VTHATRPFLALDYAFRVVVEGCAGGLVHHLEHLFGGFGAPVAGAAVAEVSIVRRGRVWRVDRPGEPPLETRRAAAVLGLLVWHLNQAVTATSDRRMLFHAAAVAPPGGDVVVCAAPSGSGKSTLAASMLQRGWSYLTDEAAAVNPGESVCHAYPKPLAIGPGSQGVLYDVEPSFPARLGAYRGDEWLVPVRLTSVRQQAPIVAVVAPRYESGRASELQPIPRSEGVRVLVENSFNFRDHGREWLGALIDVVRNTECARLIVGDDGRAPDLVASIAGAPA